MKNGQVLGLQFPLWRNCGKTHQDSAARRANKEMQLRKGEEEKCTSDNQLGGEVDGGRLVGGDAGVGAAVGGAEGEEEDVAAEDVILHLVAARDNAIPSGRNARNTMLSVGNTIEAGEGSGFTWMSVGGSNVSPSFFHSISIGMSPEEIVHDT